MVDECQLFGRIGIGVGNAISVRIGFIYHRSVYARAAIVKIHLNNWVSDAMHIT